MRRSHRNMNRRHFCTAGSAMLASAWLATRAKGQSNDAAFEQWRPCVDVAQIFAPETDDPLQQPPVREGEDDPPAPVDLALLDQNPDLANLISAAPEAARAAALDALASPEETLGSDLPARAPLQMAVQSKWPIDKLSVYFYGNLPQSFKTQILDIASEWTNFAKIDFSQTSNRNNANIRVAVQPVGGHWSYVGLDNMNARGQTMNLELTTAPKKGDYNYGVVLHEFGHALGCIHEHQNPNAGGFFNEQAVYAYYAQKYGWSRDKIALNVLKRYNHTQLLRGFVTELDRRSIMMYSNPPQLTLDGKGTPVNVELSQTDKATIARLYPGRADVPKPPVEGEDPPEPAPPASLAANGDITPSAITIRSPMNQFDFEIKESGTYTLVTYGATQVVLKLVRQGAGDLKVSETTPDLVNRVVRAELPTGKYHVEVRHKYPGGVGEYGIQLLKGDR